MRWLRPMLVLALAAGSVVLLRWGCHEVSPFERWKRQPTVPIEVVVVDYTVPFVNYREHSGVMWVLNHNKVWTPDRVPWWLPGRHYRGYSPTDRNRPVRVSELDLSSADLVYVADTYGVYTKDLEHIDEQIAHMDYSKLVFGGMSDADAAALTSYVRDEGVLVAEFNSFCDPTPASARAVMEELLGVQWTTWVGRVFPDPRDPYDVPHWFEREFSRQYPGRPFPEGPVLLLIKNDGTLHVFEGDEVEQVAPRVVMTPTGAHLFPDAHSGAPYYYWFAFVRPEQGTRVYAELVLPQRADLSALLAEIELAPRTPAMTELAAHGGRAIYLAGDLGEPDFDPGNFSEAGVVARRAAEAKLFAGVTQAPLFWRFYVPVMTVVLHQVAARAEQPIP